MTIDPTNFHFYVEPLGKNHDRSAFSSGSPALDAYFRTQARQDAEKNAAATFVLLDTRTKTITGFYSLSSTAIPLDKIPPEIAKKLHAQLAAWRKSIGAPMPTPNIPVTTSSR